MTTPPHPASQFPTAPSLDEVRARFPALAGPTVFFENAGGSQVPGAVADAIRDYMRESYVQLGAGYPQSRRATATVEAAHAFAERLVGGEATGRAILGASSTALLYMLADCYERFLPPGREIVIAETGHEANIGPWLRLEKAGHVIRWWRVDPEPGDCRLAHLDALLTERTALVVLPQVSNLLGAVVNVAEVARRAHAVGARIVVDGVAFAPHRPVDVAAWDVDWYVYSTYKVYGPHMAVLYGRHDALAELTGPNHFFIPRATIPYKFELGGASHEGCAGLVALQGYLNFLAGEPEGGDATRAAIVRAFERMGAMELPLQDRLVGWLREQPGVRLVGPPTGGVERVPTVSFLHERLSPPQLSAAMDETGVALRHGHMYAFRLCQALGIPTDSGVVRISMLHYNTPAEVERAIGELDRLFASARPL